MRSINRYAARAQARATEFACLEHRRHARQPSASARSLAVGEATLEAAAPVGVAVSPWRHGIAFNHSILAARDRHESAAFLAGLLGLAEPTTWGPFAIVTFEDGTFIQFAEPPVDEIQMQHYAFLVDDDAFDAIYQRLLDRRIAHWADPQRSQPGQINTNHGGRGVYFMDPAGHGLEVLTRPYGAEAR